MNSTELYKNVITTVRTLLEANAGDEATEYLLLNAGAMILEISSDEMRELLNNPELAAPEEPRYTESWYREDLETALKEAEIEVTDANVSTLLEACKDNKLWEDLSGRRENLADLARSIFQYNTQINYLYRDADNYKKLNMVVVKGTISDAEIREIIGCLHDGEEFIPCQIGFPEERFADRTSADHCWFELDAASFVKTKLQPTLDMAAEEVVERFKEAKGHWNESLYPVIY